MQILSAISGECGLRQKRAASVQIEAAAAMAKFNGSSAGSLEDCEAAGRWGYAGADRAGSGSDAKSGGSGGMDLRQSTGREGWG